MDNMKLFRARLVQTSYLEVEVEAEDADEANDILAERLNDGYYDFDDGEECVDIDRLEEYYDLDEDEDLDEE